MLVTSLQTIDDVGFPLLLPTLGGPCPHIPGPSNRVLAISQQLHVAKALPALFDHELAPFPTRYAASIPAEVRARSAGQPGTPEPVRARTRPIRQVAVLEMTGRLRDVAADLDRAIQVALADEPRGVVCDLSAVVGGAEQGAVERLATAGRHVRDWPGVPVAMACPDAQIREALKAQPLARHLIVTESTFTAVSAALSTPVLVVERLRLAADPTAPRAAKKFVTSILRDWQLGQVSPFACVVVGHLVAGSSAHAGSDIEVSVCWNAGALRLSVRDHSPEVPGQRHAARDLEGRGLTVVVAGLSRAFGVLPAADGGKVVWAVLEAPHRRPSACTHARPVSSTRVVQASS